MSSDEAVSRKRLAVVFLCAVLLVPLFPDLSSGSANLPLPLSPTLVADDDDDPEDECASSSRPTSVGVFEVIVGLVQFPLDLRFVLLAGTGQPSHVAEAERPRAPPQPTVPSSLLHDPSVIAHRMRLSLRDAPLLVSGPLCRPKVQPPGHGRA